MFGSWDRDLIVDNNCTSLDNLCLNTARPVSEKIKCNMVTIVNINNKILDVYA